MELQACQTADCTLVQVKSTLRQRTLIAGIADGLSIAEAGRQAGYSDRHAAHDAFTNMRDRLIENMDKVGLSEWEILARVRELADADKVQVVSRPDGIVRIDVPDNATRVKAIEIAANLRGMLKRDNSPQIGTVNILWTGHAPSWTNSQPQLPNGNGERVVTETVPDSIQSANSNTTIPVQSVTDSTTHTPTLSAVEGTGAEGGAPTRAHSAKPVSSSVGTLAQHTKVVTVSESAGSSAAPAKVVKKRKPRLPVYRGLK